MFNREFFLEKLIAPILTSLITGAVLLYIANHINDSLSGIKKDSEVKSIEQKYKIANQLNIILNATQSQMNSTRDFVNSVHGGVKIAIENGNSDAVAYEKVKNLQILMEAMGEDMKTVSLNKTTINEQYMEVLKNAEIYDVYHNEKIYDRIKKLFALNIRLNQEFEQGFHSTVRPMHTKVLDGQKNGELLNALGQGDVENIYKNLPTYENTINSMQKTTNEISKEIDLIAKSLKN